MPLTQEELKLVEYGKKQGKTKDQVLKALSQYRLENSAPTQAQGSGVRGFVSDAVTDIKQTGSNLRETFADTISDVKDVKKSLSSGEQGDARSIFQATGELAGGISNAAGDLVTGAVKTVLPQSAEDKLKGAINKTAEPIVNSNIAQNLVSRYESLDPKTKRDVDAILGIGGLVSEVATGGVGADVTKQVVKRGAKLINASTETIGEGVDVVKRNIADKTNKVLYTIEDVTERIKSPDLSEAVKVSLNPKEALKMRGQDIDVSVGGKVKKLSQITPTENTKLKVSTERSLDNFTKQAEKFARDRSVEGGSPVEIVGGRVDGALDFADKKRQTVGKKMGEIEESLGTEVVNVGDKTMSAIEELSNITKQSSYGVNDSASRIVSKLGNDLVALEKNGLTIAERNKFVRSWQQYLNDAKDPFGNFKENGSINLKIQNVVNKVKDETVEAVSSKNKKYRNLRAQYSMYKKLDEIGNSLLGKEGALGERIKGASLVKRAIQSNSDAGARQFLIKLRELTGYDAIKEGDLALTAMEMVGDYQGLSLLNILKEGKTGLVNKALEFVRNKTVGSNPERVKKYIKK
jgi:hypothetical protein